MVRTPRRSGIIFARPTSPLRQGSFWRQFLSFVCDRSANRPCNALRHGQANGSVKRFDLDKHHIRSVVRDYNSQARHAAPFRLWWQFVLAHVTSSPILESPSGSRWRQRPPALSVCAMQDTQLGLLQPNDIPNQTRQRRQAQRSSGRLIVVAQVELANVTGISPSTTRHGF